MYYNINNRNELLTQIQEVYSRRKDKSEEIVKLIRFYCTVVLNGG